MKKIILTALVSVIAFSSYAQTKTGSIDVEFILGNMTDQLAVVNDSLKAYQEKLSVKLDEKMTNYETKYKAYEAGQAAMTDALKKTKSQEIVEIENDIRQYRQNGQQLIQLKRDELLGPLYQAIGTALDAESKQQGYTHVLTTGSGALGYIDPKYDLTEAVMKRMGVTVKEQAQQQPQDGN